MDTDVYRLIGLSCALFFSCSVCSTIPPNDTPPPFVILTALGTVPQSQQNMHLLYVPSIYCFFFFLHMFRRGHNKMI